MESIACLCCMVWRLCLSVLDLCCRFLTRFLFVDLGSVDGNKQRGLSSVTESLSCLVQLHISLLLAYVGVPSSQVSIVC